MERPRGTVMEVEWLSVGLTERKKQGDRKNPGKRPQGWERQGPEGHLEL